MCNRLLFAALWAIWTFSALNARAELTIEITQGVDNPMSIAVVPFEWRSTEALPENIPSIVSSDLHRSGQFEPVSQGEMLGLPHRASEVFYRDWRAINVDYLVIGRIAPDAQGTLAIQYELFDVYTQKQIFAASERTSRTAMRDAAHRISDRIYEKLTGIRGAFSTKLLYIAASNLGRGQFNYRLMLSDIDGARERVIREQRQPMLTPTWAPDGQSIAYVSFETTRPAIFLHNLRTGRREQLTNFKGLNGAPVFSPDGRRLALVLSKDGSPDIYVMDLASRQLTRVTDHFAIDTEPSWMPDGRSLIFTSDRGGKPQIYEVTLATRYVERLTFDGDYNARPRVLADGRGFIMVHRYEGDYHIAIQHIERQRIEVLTKTQLDESPSIAPNDTMMIYATLHGGKGILAAVSVDGGVKYRLPSKFGDVREPAWSPFLN